MNSLRAACILPIFPVALFLFLTDRCSPFVRAAADGFISSFRPAHDKSIYFQAMLSQNHLVQASTRDSPQEFHLSLVKSEGHFGHLSPIISHSMIDRLGLSVGRMGKKFIYAWSRKSSPILVCFHRLRMSCVNAFQWCGAFPPNLGAFQGFCPDDISIFSYITFTQLQVIWNRHKNAMQYIYMKKKCLIGGRFYFYLKIPKFCKIQCHCAK